MQITHVSVPVRRLDEAGEYFSALGFPLKPGQGPEHTIDVRVGFSTLTLREDPEASGSWHLAFTIPARTFVAAKRWLTPRAQLVELDGADEFDGPEHWNSRSVYFDGPEGSILELIARHDLDEGEPRDLAAREFAATDIVSISEVGVPVADVFATAAQLGSTLGLDPYAGEPSALFAPVGDIHGLLILVALGRTWFPTANRTALPDSIRITATGPRAGRLPLGHGSVLEVLAG
jgi:catechol-2,3-dioxygenase